MCVSARDHICVHLPETTCVSDREISLLAGCEALTAALIDAIRRVLQCPSLPRQPKIVTALALLLPSIAQPPARAALVWSVASHAAKSP